MAVPKQRRTESKQGSRRSHDALKHMMFSRCPKCGKDVLPHRVCENCGTYRKREVINVFLKLDKKERKRREREQAAHEKEQGEETPSVGGAESLAELSKK